jgi:hypothetical protein
MTRFIAIALLIDLQPLSATQAGVFAYESGVWTHTDRDSGSVVDDGSYL